MLVASVQARRRRISKEIAGSGTNTRSAPRSGTLTCNPAEESAEVSLVGQAALECDLAERRVSRQHEPLGTFNAPSDHILEW